MWESNGFIGVSKQNCFEWNLLPYYDSRPEFVENLKNSSIQLQHFGIFPVRVGTGLLVG